MGDFTVPSFVQIRPVDLYVTKGYRQDGVVLVGDAFSSSCPAAGTGARKVLVDVERLCNVHIPRWLATPGMGEAKIAAFYDDPVKQACDALSSAGRLSSCGRIRSIPRRIGPRCAGPNSSAHWGRGMLRRFDSPRHASSSDRDEAQDGRRRPGRAARRRTNSALAAVISEC